MDSWGRGVSSADRCNVCDYAAVFGSNFALAPSFLPCSPAIDPKLLLFFCKSIVNLHVLEVWLRSASIFLLIVVHL